MNWDALGAIAETLGALGVIGSLLYLSVQIRAQNQEARLAAVHELSIGFREAIASFSDGEISEILVRANSDFDSLSDSEKVRMIAVGAVVLRVFEEAFIQNAEGRLDHRNWGSYARYLAMFMDGHCLKRVWELRGPYMDTDFQRFVKNLETSGYRIS